MDGDWKLTAIWNVIACGSGETPPHPPEQSPVSPGPGAPQGGGQGRQEQGPVPAASPGACSHLWGWLKEEKIPVPLCLKPSPQQALQYLSPTAPAPVSTLT